VIYLFYGSDSEKARRQAFAFAEGARKKQPDVAYLRLAREDLSAGTLEEVTSAGGLFVRRLLVLLDDPFPVARKAEDDEDAGDSPSIIEDYLDALAGSDNAIIILAPKLNAAKAKKLAAKAEKEYKFDKSAAGEVRSGFNGALVNALAAKDGKKLWLEVVRALEAGDAPEQVHGLLHWKARDLLEKRPSPAARKLSLDLITLLMNSRRTGADLGESLERFALSI
jgi:hypothetical protein